MTSRDPRARRALADALHKIKVAQGLSTSDDKPLSPAQRKVHVDDRPPMDDQPDVGQRTRRN